MTGKEKPVRRFIKLPGEEDETDKLAKLEKHAEVQEAEVQLLTGELRKARDEIDRLRDHTEELEKRVAGAQVEIAQQHKLITQKHRVAQEQWDRAEALETQIKHLRTAVRIGIGTAINELISRDMKPEWSASGGIGKMLAALGCYEVRLTDEVRKLLEED